MAIVEEKRPAANCFVRFARKLYTPLHFNRGYNFFLFFVLAGAFFGFTLSRLMFLDIDGVFCNPLNKDPVRGAAPGECYFFGGKAGLRYKLGILLHLTAILPGSILAMFQFMPVIRHKLLLLHRINGYIILLLCLVSTAGVLMIAGVSFGGGLATQTGVGFNASAFLGSLTMAYINIKRLQIEQHRAWMLRAWIYAGTIITVRFIMIISSVIITNIGTFYDTRPCYQIDWVFATYQLQNLTKILYPVCTGENPHQHAVVHANLEGDPIEIAAALGMSFEMAIWLAMTIHAMGVEIYLHLTPREAERLRKVSYQRQVAAGMKQPGDAGLTAEKLGDAVPWVPNGA